MDDYSWLETFSNQGSASSHSLRSAVLAPWPGPRHSHAMASDFDGTIIYMLGGISENDTTLCEDAFWTFDTETDMWTNLEDWNAISRRVGHSMVKTQNSLIIVGGYGADSSYGFDFLAAIFDLECSTVKIVTQVIFVMHFLKLVILFFK